MEEKDIESLLICPVCSQKLIKQKGEFFCRNCRAAYSIINGVPLLIKPLDDHKKKEIAYHSQVSEVYRDLHQLHTCRNRYYHLQALEPIFRLGKGSNVLELGGGTGYDGAFLLQRGFNIVQTDISIGQVLQAKNHLGLMKTNSSAYFYVVDAENIPFEDNSFDATFITAALHHLENPEVALSEMKRCTRKNGVIVVSMEPNRYEWIRIVGYLFVIVKSLLFFLFGENRFKNPLKRGKLWDEPNIERTFSKGELISLLRSAGLYPRKIKPVWFSLGFIHWFITLLNKLSKKRWYINRDIEAIFVQIDELTSHIPFVNLLCCHWTIHCNVNK